LGYLLLDKQEKVTGPQGCGTNMQGCGSVFATEAFSNQRNEKHHPTHCRTLDSPPGAPCTLDP